MTITGPYAPPQLSKPSRLGKKQILLVASGDLRQSANEKCWPEQAKMEQQLTDAVANAGYELIRAHPYKESVGHGFISSQKEGMRIFAEFDPKAPLIVAEAVWQYSHHVLHGLITHRGPILTVANWSGTWPGLVGMLNLNGSLTKAGVKYSTIWSEDFSDAFFLDYLNQWLKHGRAKHRTSHVTKWKNVKVGSKERKLGRGTGRAAAAREGDHGHFRRRLHGNVQRHHSRSSAQSHRRLQRAAQPIDAVLRNDASLRCPGRRSL